MAEHSDATKNIIRMRGEKVSLALLRDDDEAIEKYLAWLSDESYNAWILQSGNALNRKGERDWIASCSASERRFSIIDNASQEMVGNCSVRLSKDGCTASLGILIGEHSAQGRGLGTEVVRMLVKFSFDNLRAHRVELSVCADNERARRCYETAGFVTCGIQHEMHWYQGAWHDSIIMEILHDRWMRLQGTTR